MEPAGPRQIDPDRRAPLRRAHDINLAARLLHDGVYRRHAEAGALPASLGGEERLEDAGPGLLVHPHAVVEDVLASSDRPAGGLDRDPASRLDGIARVQDQVHDHLLDLRAVGVDHPRIRTQRGHQLASNRVPVSPPQPPTTPAVLTPFGQRMTAIGTPDRNHAARETGHQLSVPNMDCGSNRTEKPDKACPLRKRVPQRA